MSSNLLESINQSVGSDLKLSRKKVKRLKYVAIGKLVVTGAVLTASVVTGVLFPNPVSLTAIMGCAAILSGSEGIKHTFGRLKKTKNTKKQIEKADQQTEEKILVDSVVQEVQAPSAPPAYVETSLYPNLRI